MAFSRTRIFSARLFYVLILVRIIARRVPIYKREWATKTASMVERAEQVLHQATKV